MASYLIPVTADGGFSQTPTTGEPAIEFATEAYVGTAISNLVDTAPTTLDTLNELAAALGDDANYASTITTALGNKADTSSLATVATSGSYTDLSNKPTIITSYTSLTDKPTIPTNTNQLTNGAGFLTSVGTISYTDLSNKPTIPTNTNQLTNGAGFITSNGIPTQTGNSGKYLTTNGSAVSWATVAGGSGTDYSTVTKIKIGQNAGQAGQGTEAIAIGSGAAGLAAQANYGLAIGVSAGLEQSGLFSIAIGTQAGSTQSGTNSISIGYLAGYAQSGSSIILNASGAQLNDGGTSGFFVDPVRNDTGNVTNVVYYNSSTKELTYGPAGGGGGGTDYSTLSEIAIGVGAADAFSPSAPQGSNGIAIGSYAGADAQGANSVSIGAGAGGLIQGANSIALGENAANNYQGNNSIAIGTNAGRLSQGNYAIAIGTNAGYSYQPASSICINASQFDMQPSVAGLYIKPVRSATTSNVIYYDSDTGEMTYGAAPSGSGGGGGSGGGEDATAFSYNATIVGPLYGTVFPWTPPTKTGPMIAILAAEPWSTIWTASSNGTTQKNTRAGSSISPPWASAWYGTVSGSQNATTQNSQNGGYGSYSAYSLDSSTNPATDEMWAGTMMANIDASTGVVSVSNVYSSIGWSPTSPGYLYGYINTSIASNELAGFTGEAGVTWLLDVEYSRIRVIVPPSVWAANGGQGGPIGTITGLSPSGSYNASISGLIFGV